MGIVETLFSAACKVAGVALAQRVVAAVINRNSIELKKFLPAISQSKELMSEAISGFDPEILTLHECATVLTSCRMHEIDDTTFRKRLIISMSQINAFMTVM